MKDEAETVMRGLLKRLLFLFLQTHELIQDLKNRNNKKKPAR